MVFGDISEVVEDQQKVFVEFGDGGLEREFAAGELELLDEVGGACEQHAPAVFDEGEADGRSEMALSAAGRSSDILQGIRTTKGRFFIRFIQNLVRLLR